MRKKKSNDLLLFWLKQYVREYVAEWENITGEIREQRKQSW